MMVQKEGDAAKERAADDAKREENIKEAQAGRSEAAAKAGERAEKVSVLEPMAYENRYNYNKIDGKFLMRTTFYGQQYPQYSA